MAYIKTEEVKNIRTQLKKEFPNLKFSVTRLHMSKVKIIVLSGDIDFLAKTEESVKAYKRIEQIAKSQNYYDNSDAMIDYFDIAYYTEVRIGDWNKDYLFVQLKVAA